MSKLINILEELENHKVEFSVCNSKIDVYGKLDLRIQKYSTKGYFHIMFNDIALYLFSVRDIKKYDISYNNDKVHCVTFDNIRIVFI